MQMLMLKHIFYPGNEQIKTSTVIIVVISSERVNSTQNICATFIQCWSNVEDVGPTLYKCCTNVLCLL